jgi:hypothetical protein
MIKKNILFTKKDLGVFPLIIYQQMSTEKTSKNIKVFECISCNFICSKKGDYNRHLLTDKHKKKGFQQKNIKNHQNTSNDNICECGRLYKERSGLWRHKKKCSFVSYLSCETQCKQTYTDKKDELIDYLIKENKEIKELILELAKKDTYTTTHNTNSHNKSFNLQFFLNETCKDAMNIMDFVDSIKLQLSDLERVGELGFIDGISNIIVKNLKELDVTERPIHCTDKKREILYVKNENKWEKEDDEKKKIRKVIKNVANKNILLLQKFKEAHPDCGKSVSKFSDQYNKIVVEAMGGYGDNDYEKEEKIIQKISKNVTIDKDLTI